MLPNLMKQSDVAALILRRMNVTAGTRFTTAQTYLAMNNALMLMGERARTPFQYTFTFVSGTREYTLPTYIDGDAITVQWKSAVYPWNLITNDDTSERVWDTIALWHIYPDATGTRVLRLDVDPPDTDGRIIYWTPPYPIPTPSTGTLPVSSAEISSSATSVTLTTKPTLGRNGYIKLDAEWMEYHGYTEAATTYTLTNLVRGIQGTTAATHVITSTVEWGIAVDNPILFTILQSETIAELCGLYMLNPGTDAGKYEDMWRREKQIAYESWMKVSSNRPAMSRPRDMGWVI
jgi:hypothetical protein